MASNRRAARYAAQQRGDIPMTVDQFCRTSGAFQGIVHNIAECVMLGREIPISEFRRAHWAMFAIRHWHKRLIIATRWEERIAFRVWNIPNSTLIGSTAHEAAFPLAACFDPGFLDDVGLSGHPEDWNLDELRTLNAKLEQECILLQEHAVSSDDDGLSMKFLCHAAGVSDTQMRKYVRAAGLDTGDRGRQRVFSPFEVRAICETVLDTPSSASKTKAAFGTLLQRLLVTSENRTTEL